MLNFKKMTFIPVLKIQNWFHFTAEREILAQVVIKARGHGFQCDSAERAR